MKQQQRVSKEARKTVQVHIGGGQCKHCSATTIIRRPLPTAGEARQRRDYKQQVLCSASEGQVRGRTEREARCSARSTKTEARKEGQSQRKKQAKEARNKKLEARIQKQELTSDGS